MATRQTRLGGWLAQYACIWALILAISGGIGMATGIVTLGHAQTDTTSAVATTEVATFGAGCFWCVEWEFQKLPGVLRVTSGFMGGRVANPSYADVVQTDTGHAEVIHIEYDTTQIDYATLLATFWNIHDPTQLNRQGPDVGPQYRSAIFYHTPEQQALAQASMAEEGRKPQYQQRPIVTELTAAGPFYPAEDYHQNYYDKNPLKRMMYEAWKASKR